MYWLCYLLVNTLLLSFIPAKQNQNGTSTIRYAEINVYSGLFDFYFSWQCCKLFPWRQQHSTKMVRVDCVIGFTFNKNLRQLDLRAKTIQYSIIHVGFEWCPLCLNRGPRQRPVVDSQRKFSWQGWTRADVEKVSSSTDCVKQIQF